MIEKQFDVVVLGGGPAGVGAAVAAARAGASVALVERYGFLGGMGTIAGVTNFCGFWAQIRGTQAPIVAGIGGEVLRAMDERRALRAPHLVLGRIEARGYDNAVYKIVLDRIVADAGVNLVFHAFADGATVRDGRVESMTVTTKSGRANFRARVFVDASGDADLAAWSGCPFELDRDALAYPTLMFRVGGVDDAVALAEGKPRLRELVLAEKREGRLLAVRNALWANPQPHPGEWRVNGTQLAFEGRAVDGTSADELTFAEIEGRRQIDALMTFLRARVPGFSEAYLLEVAPQVGIRETRRIVGGYVLDEDHVLGARTAPDSIGLCGWPVERHVEGDVTWEFLPEPGAYEIPARVLYPQNVENLLVAGRCASATARAQASLRVTGPCFAMGEAAGNLTALVGKNGDVRAVDPSALQARLIAGGAMLRVPS